DDEGLKASGAGEDKDHPEVSKNEDAVIAHNQPLKVGCPACENTVTVGERMDSGIGTSTAQLVPTTCTMETEKAESCVWSDESSHSDTPAAVECCSSGSHVVVDYDSAGCEVNAEEDKQNPPVKAVVHEEPTTTPTTDPAAEQIAEAAKRWAAFASNAKPEVHPATQDDRVGTGNLHRTGRN
ncbi:hypothetical protein HK102_002857, partial [Quaeritorhiza haematococci]